MELPTDTIQGCSPVPGLAGASPDTIQGCSPVPGIAGAPPDTQILYRGVVLSQGKLELPTDTTVYRDVVISVQSSPIYQ